MMFELRVRYPPMLNCNSFAFKCHLKLKKNQIYKLKLKEIQTAIKYYRMKKLISNILSNLYHDTYNTK